jgi:hypothetical protein
VQHDGLVLTCGPPGHRCVYLRVRNKFCLCLNEVISHCNSRLCSFAYSGSALCWHTSNTMTSQSEAIYVLINHIRGIESALVHYLKVSGPHNTSVLSRKRKTNYKSLPFRDTERKYQSCIAMWLQYVPQVLTFTNSAFCPHSVFMCFVWIWEQTAIISLYSINWLIFITKTECVYCAVRYAHTVYVFCVDLRTNTDYFTVQH